jgi:predicted HicB family RNase H-like nuclease
MAKARIEVDENLHRALSIQAVKAGMSLKDYVTSILTPHVDKETWDYLGIDRG